MREARDERLCVCQPLYLSGAGGFSPGQAVCLSIDQGCLQSVWCFKSEMVSVKVVVIVEVSLGMLLSYLLCLSFFRHRQRQKENMKEQYSF